MSCISFNVIYVVIGSELLEKYVGEICLDKTILRKYQSIRQHAKQPENQKLKVEEHI